LQDVTGTANIKQAITASPAILQDITGIANIKQALATEAKVVKTIEVEVEL
jgi:hypothetical protein